MRNVIILYVLFPLFVFAQPDRVKVTGEYSYTYGDNESLLEAKSLCYTMAIRNAIESLTVFVQSTATVDNYSLKNDLIQTIASGYIDNLLIEEETVKGRNVYYKISGNVNPYAVKNIIKNKVNLLSNKSLDGIDENSYLKILRIWENEEKIYIVYKSKISTNVNYNRTKQEYIYVDFYNSQGYPITGKKDSVVPKLAPGEIRTIYFYKPKNAKSYKVWLYKGK